MRDTTFSPDMGRLSDPEILVVRTWRKMVFSHGACLSIGEEFDFESRTEVPHAVGEFLAALAQGVRHRLTIGHPGCLHVTADEHQMLALIAACQNGNTILLQSHLSWLVRPCRQKPVAEAAHALALTLHMHGLAFQARTPRAQTGRPSLALVHERSRASLH